VFAAQHDAVRGQTPPFRKAQHEPAKIPGLHPCVAAELVHLVRRGLHQEVAILAENLQNRSLDDQRVRRADRVHAYGLARLVLLHSLHSLQQQIAHEGLPPACSTHRTQAWRAVSGRRLTLLYCLPCERLAEHSIVGRDDANLDPQFSDSGPQSKVTET